MHPRGDQQRAHSKFKRKTLFYLDDIKENPLSQSHSYNEAVIQSLNSKDLCKRTPLCCDTYAYQPLPQEPSKKKSDRHMNRKRALTGGKNDFSLTEGHVHPKLPHYEELEAKFKR